MIREPSGLKLMQSTLIFIYIASSTTVEELYQYARLTFVRLCKTNDRRIRPADVDKPVADVTD